MMIQAETNKASISLGYKKAEVYARLANSESEERNEDQDAKKSY